ncbi:MAG: hypothetical protein FWG03_08465 [Clostridiales bacterium]|nr:hypothetical protein [Clostridiales bacterium]
MNSEEKALVEIKALIDASVAKLKEEDKTRPLATGLDGNSEQRKAEIRCLWEEAQAILKKYGLDGEENGGKVGDIMAGNCG